MKLVRRKKDIETKNKETPVLKQNETNDNNKISRTNEPDVNSMLYYRMIALEEELSRYKAIIISKDETIMALQKKIKELENENLQYQQNLYNSIQSQKKRTNNNNHNNIPQFEPDDIYEINDTHFNSSNLIPAQSEIIHNLRDIQHINESLIDPVQEVENHIINELYPNPDNMTYEQILSLEDQLGSIKKGLSPKEIATLPYFFYNFSLKYQGKEECIICQDKFQNKEKIRILPCEHCFHVQCIDQWLIENKTCPCCKKEIKP